MPTAAWPLSMQAKKLKVSGNTVNSLEGLFNEIVKVVLIKEHTYTCV